MTPSTDSALILALFYQCTRAGELPLLISWLHKNRFCLWIIIIKLFFSYSFLYDFNLKNKIIEFNGDIYHGNPNFFKEDDICINYKIPIIIQCNQVKVSI